MKKIAIVYGSYQGNAENVANMIAQYIGEDLATVINVSEAKKEDLEQYENLILGASTWGVGDLQDDWEEFLPQFLTLNLEGKNIALFGVGNGESNSTTFAESMYHLYEAVKDKGCKILKGVSADDYTFDESEAVIDGEFVGLAIDEDNESDKTAERIKNWIDVIRPEFA